ncbi:hypothetical protein NPIL_292151 [Nephila pilipes]|uniref:Uncharacterized protein n=1 Tax=Nephila pilipes TaxID=299642 RepID=A0A8X6QAC2_NEPPI|nr:hypothetical protein NPIL_292151 [Nephila pilipes]
MSEVGLSGLRGRILIGYYGVFENRALLVTETLRARTLRWHFFESYSSNNCLRMFIRSERNSRHLVQKRIRGHPVHGVSVSFLLRFIAAHCKLRRM